MIIAYIKGIGKITEENIVPYKSNSKAKFIMFSKNNIVNKR